jgi:hemerythrin
MGLGSRGVEVEAMNEVISVDCGFDWDDAYLLGHPAMDETHREFVTCIDALLKADDDTLPAALDALTGHALRHFDDERAWMDSGGPGNEFPARDCHVDEHEKVLASLREVQESVAGGERQIARELGQALKDWFPGHTDYMDSALSQWLCKRAFGGKPLVLKRLNLKSA